MKFFWLTIFIIFSFAASSQRQLVLVNGNTIVSHYFEGDAIRFQRKGQNFFTSGVITGIHLDFIKMGEEDTIYVYEIRKIDLRHHSNTNFKTASSGRKLIIAGVVLLLMDALYPSESHPIDRGVATVSAAFVGTGILLQFINNNYYKIGRRKKAAIVG